MPIFNIWNFKYPNSRYRRKFGNEYLNDICAMSKFISCEINYELYTKKKMK